MSQVLRNKTVTRYDNIIPLFYVLIPFFHRKNKGNFDNVTYVLDILLHFMD